MGNGPIVSIYTQVYNTKTYLTQCLDSVLKQRLSDFEYILVDNGSTDGCREIMERYATQDSRIRLVHFEENRIGPIFQEIIKNIATGRYVTCLDSDDWWESDYLESLIAFLEKNHLDLAITGTVNYYEETRTSQILRKLDAPIVLTRQQFAECYPQFWTFPSTNWANIMRTELFKKSTLSDVLAAKLSNGGDTISMLKYMEQCDRIGIDSTALYHYRIRSKQISRQYNSRRFDSNVCCAESIRSFLELNHTFDQPKQDWLKLVYLNLTDMTLRLLNKSELSADGKIAECARIVTHPLTSVALSHSCQEREQWFQSVWEITFHTIGDDELTDHTSLQSILAALAPRCSPVVTKDTVSLFMREPALVSTLYQDAPDRLANALLDFIADKQYIKQYDLAGMLQKLAVDKPLLCCINDTQFLRRYHDLYRLVWEGKFLEALDSMTGMLLGKKVQKAGDTFLQLYLSLAAYLEQVPAFLFGKTRQAAFFLRQGQTEECRAVLEELDEMGAADNEEVHRIYSALKALPQ